MTRSLLVVACSAALIGCGGKGGELGAVLAVAGTLKVIQSVRARSVAVQPSSIECHVYCDGCSFPCGDNCVPWGTLCYDPPGRACWKGGRNLHEVPPDLDQRCAMQFMIPVDPLYH